METFTVHAVYKKGMLKPTKKIKLPEDSLVEIRVRTIKTRKAAKSSLFGAFPELAAITDKNIHDIKKSWNRSAKRQQRIAKRAK